MIRAVEAREVLKNRDVDMGLAHHGEGSGLKKGGDVEMRQMRQSPVKRSSAAGSEGYWSGAEDEIEGGGWGVGATGFFDDASESDAGEWHDASPGKGYRGYSQLSWDLGEGR